MTAECDERCSVSKGMNSDAVRVLNAFEIGTLHVEHYAPLYGETTKRCMKRSYPIFSLVFSFLYSFRPSYFSVVGSRQVVHLLTLNSFPRTVVVVIAPSMSGVSTGNPAAGVPRNGEITPPLTLLLQKIALAGFSNIVASTITNPFDLIKVRQQLQSSSTTVTADGKVIKLRPTFWGRTLYTMITTEGVFSIYKGLAASWLREASYSGIRFGAYDMCKGAVLSVVPYIDKDSFGTKLLAGMASGMLGAGVANPADVLKIRMQAFGATGTLRHHTASVYNAHGFLGFYRALGPTMFRAGILTSAQLGVYDQSKQILKNDFPTVFREGFVTHLAASGMAGFCCSAVSAPVDTIKVRMMADTNRQFSGALHCTAMLLSHEGPLALYNGATMCFLRLWPQSVISLLVFEVARKAAGIAPI